MSTAFLTDFYELSMLQAALENGKADKKAVFELFARRLPHGRTYGVVGGVNRAIEAVKEFRFNEEQLSYLASDPLFHEETLAYLRAFEFKGTIRSYQEGELYFPYSPIITVEATFGEAVVIETVLLSILNHDSAVASAASRITLASEGLGRPVKLIEMGTRRTHEDAAVASSALAYMMGFDATSNLQAGLIHGVPTTGTSAHAFTLLHETEMEAFRNQIASLGVGTTLLIDTYDIPTGIKNAVAAAQEVGAKGPGAIRIDSGDLVEETLKARALLDSLGATQTKIVLSSDMDEWAIEELAQAEAPVDGIGVGTRLVTGSGHPTAGMVYKLVAIEDHEGVMVPVEKKSAGKKSVGGKKFAYRDYTPQGFIKEEFYLKEESSIREALQVTYVEQGKFTSLPTIHEVREFHKSRRKQLPPEAKALEGIAAFEALQK